MYNPGLGDGSGMYTGLLPSPNLMPMNTMQMNGKDHQIRSPIPIYDPQEQIAWLKQEIQGKETKLEECQMSIKSFWNPELKKERMARVTENEKYQQLKENYAKLLEDNNRNQNVIQQLSDELQMQREVNTTVLPQTDNQMQVLKTTNSQKDKEIYLLRKTLEEMELRVETQKETLASRDQSIQKLLEIIQDRGLASSMETNLDYNQTKLRNVELESTLDELRTKLSHKDSEVNNLKTDLMHQLDSSRDLQRQYGADLYQSDAGRTDAFRALIDNKEDHIRNLQHRVDSLEEQIHKYKISGGVVDLNNFDNFGKQNDIYREHTSFLKAKVDHLRSEISKKESEIITQQTKLDMLSKQQTDHSSHINVLRENLATKEQQISSLQADNDSLRSRMHDKEQHMQKKTMEIDTICAEKSSFEAELREVLSIKEKKIYNMEKKISEMEDQIIDREQRLQALTSQKVSNHTSGNVDQELLNTLERTLGEKERQIESMRDQKNREIKTRLEEIDLYARISKELQGKNEDLTHQMTDRESQLADTSEKASGLLVSNMKKDSQIKVLTTSLSKKQEELLDLERRVKRQNEEKVVLMKEKQEMQKQVSALEEQVNHYIDELAKTQGQVDRLTEILKRCEQEKKIHERRVNELDANLNGIKTRLNGIKQTKEEERAANAQLIYDARRREGDVIQDVQELQEIVAEKDRRLNELESALNETAKMTVAREAALDQHHHVTTHAQRKATLSAEKIEDLSLENENLQKALRTSNKKLGELAFQVGEKEARVQQLQLDRRRQVDEVMQLKQESLMAAINEKQANIALLENAGQANPAVTKDVKRLQEDKQKLLRQLHEMNEKRVKALHALESKVSGAKGNKRAGGKGPDEEDGVWA